MVGFTLSCLQGPAFDTGGGFFVQQGGPWCALATFRKGFYDYRAFVPALANVQYGADFHCLAAFAASVVVTHFTALNGLFGQGAGFEKACRPEPFVQANPGFRLVLT